MRALPVLVLAALSAPAAAGEGPAKPSFAKTSLAKTSLAKTLPAKTLPAKPAFAKPALCPEDAPEGVRLPERPGCDGLVPGVRRARDGWRDLGDGVRLRVGGRVAAELGTRR